MNDLTRYVTQISYLHKSQSSPAFNDPPHRMNPENVVQGTERE